MPPSSSKFCFESPPPVGTLPTHTMTPSNPSPPSPDPSSPIGVFDSGVGGLSVVLELARQLPRERMLYFADSARAPWGVRPPAEIRRLAGAAAGVLVARGAKVIVAACNTASVHALAHLRERFPAVPFVGMVPAVKTAALRTLTGHIAVMATAATAGGEALGELLGQFAEPNGVEAVLAVPAGLVEQVERGDLDGPETEALVRAALAPLLATEVDTLVLGCTHFPFVRAAVERVTGGRMQLIDAAPAVAAQCGRILMDRGLAAPAGQRGGLENLRILTTGDPETVARTAARLTGLPIRVDAVDPDFGLA